MKFKILKTSFDSRDEILKAITKDAFFNTHSIF